MQLAPVSACTEQVWNEACLDSPVQAPVWRLWRYRAPALVLGCSQRRLLGKVAAAESDLEVLQRGSGGGAVLAGPWMLGLSVVLPASHRLVQGGPVPSYRWLGERLTGVLQGGGIAARALVPGEAKRDAEEGTVPEWACFAGLSPWEVVVGRRKIVGLAQVRRCQGVLLVAGLLLDAPDWPLLCRALARPLDEAERLAALTTSWAEETGQPAVLPALAAAIDRSLLEALGRPEKFVEEEPPTRRGLASITA